MLGKRRKKRGQQHSSFRKKNEIDLTDQSSVSSDSSPPGPIEVDHQENHDHSSNFNQLKDLVTKGGSIDEILHLVSDHPALLDYEDGEHRRILDYAEKESEHYRLLHRCGAKHSQAFIEEKIREKYGRNVPDKDPITGRTPLHEASEENEGKDILLMLDHPAIDEVRDEMDNEGHTPLDLSNTKWPSYAIQQLSDFKHNLSYIKEWFKERYGTRSFFNWKAFFGKKYGKLKFFSRRTINQVEGYFNYTPLMHYIRYERPKEREKGLYSNGALLLASYPGIDLEIKNANNYTAFHFAVLTGDTDTVARLIQLGANINALAGKSFLGREKYECALHMVLPLRWKEISPALRKEYRKILNILLGEKKLKVNVKDKHGETPLHRAVALGRMEVVQRLVKKGADINAQDNRGRSPLHIALGLKNFAIAFWLIEQGGKTNLKDKNGNTALHMAAAKGFEEIIVALLKKNPPINATNGKEETPFFLTVQQEHFGLGQLLLKHKADPEKEDLNFTAPIHWAVLAAIKNKPGALAFLKTLLAIPVQVDPIDKLGATPLWWAVDTGPDEPHVVNILNLLIQHKAFLGIMDNDENTLLHLGIRKRRIKMMNLLLKVFKGISGNVKRDPITNVPTRDLWINKQNVQGRTILHSAVLMEYPLDEILKVEGLKVNLKTDRHETALQCAARVGNEEAVKQLLAIQGIEINNVSRPKSIDGRPPETALDQARTSSIQSLLKNRGAKTYQEILKEPLKKIGIH